MYRVMKNYLFLLINSKKNNDKLQSELKKLQKESKYFDIIRVEDRDCFVFGSFVPENIKEKMIFEMMLYSSYAYFKKNNIDVLEGLVFKNKDLPEFGYNLIHLKYHDTKQ